MELPTFKMLALLVLWLCFSYFLNRAQKFALVLLTFQFYMVVVNILPQYEIARQRACNCARELLFLLHVIVDKVADV